MSLLIDADYIVYKCCAATETEIDFGEDLIVVTSRFSEAYEYVERELYNIASDLGCFDDSILFFSDSVNFRKSIDPAYKGHRNRKKPCGYKRVINALKADYPVRIMRTLEADDALGIYATKEPGHIICSPDKDMRQIPGELFDLSTGVVTITPEEGPQVAPHTGYGRRSDRWLCRYPWHWYQASRGSPKGQWCYLANSS
jgi:hypothetical protein